MKKVDSLDNDNIPLQKPLIPMKYLLLFLFLLPSSAFAQGVDEATACRIAQAWWSGREGLALRSEPTPSRAFPRAYLFERQKEFLLVNRSEKGPEVLGYGSATRAITEEMLPPVLKALLSQSVSTTRSYPLDGTRWQAVAPLLSTVRRQEAPYNRDCPIVHYEGRDYPTVVGCVATAMEQILTYHRRTYTLLDSLPGWSTPYYDVPTIPAGATVDSRLILNDYDREAASEAEIDAVARLSFYLGVACRMNWGISSSSASSYRLVEPLQRAFGLSEVHYLDSYRYDPVAYWNFLAREVAARRPVYYAGSLMRTGGHAFVLDGLDSRGYFHVNWGFGGDGDGYFRLDVLAYQQPESLRPEEFAEYGFFCNQEAIAVSPDPVVNLQLPDTLERTGREIQLSDVRFGARPQTGCFTPLYLRLTNVADQALTTPLAFLLHAAPTGSTSIFEEADWMAFTGRTLQPGESAEVKVFMRFKRPGLWHFSITPDGENVIYSQRVEVGEGGTVFATSTEPEVAILNATTARISQVLTNADPANRFCEEINYELIDETTGYSVRPTYYVEIPASGQLLTDNLYPDLQPGHRYTYNLRLHWPILKSISFTMPDAPTEITDPSTLGKHSETWFSPSGLRLSARPAASGVYLRVQGNQVEKVLIR